MVRFNQARRVLKPHLVLLQPQSTRGAETLLKVTLISMMLMLMMLQVSMLTGQVAELQKSLSSLQEETDTTITKLRKELHDKATIVETLQQQIRMKMFMNLTQQKNPMIAALADLQGKKHFEQTTISPDYFL